MALKFNGDLSTGDATQWTGETDASAIGTIGADAEFDSGYRYRIATTVAGEDNTYLAKTVTNTHYRAFECSFKFRISNANVTHSSRVLRLLNLVGAASPEGYLNLSSDASGGQLDTLQFLYRTANNTQTIITAALGQAAIQSNTVHTIRLLRKESSSLGNDGIIKVWIDGVLWINSTGLDIRSGSISALQFGLHTNSTAVAFNLDVGDFKTATNSDYSEAEAEYWLDSIDGDDSNDGTEAAPWKTAFRANASVGTGTAGTGDSIVIKKRTRSNPHRMSVIGPISPYNAGTANNCVVIRSEDASDPSEIFGTVSVPPASWTGPDGEGMYYYDASALVGDNPNDNTSYPYRIYVCTEAAWQAAPFDAIDPQIVGRVAERPMSGGGTAYIWYGRLEQEQAAGPWTWAGGLAAGQAGFDPNTSRIYYRPAANETFADLHIEVPFRTSSYSAPITLNVDYAVARDIAILFGHTACVANGSNGTGSFAARCACISPGQFGVSINGTMTAYKNEGAWAVDLGWNSGTGVHTGTGGAAYIIANDCHDNANDGISLNSATVGGDISYVIGNVCYNNGVSATGNEYGIEVTGTAVGKFYFNTLVGNYGGFINQSSVTAGQECSNNISAYNQATGYNVSAAQHAADANLLDYNASFGNGGVEFNAVGTGDISAGLVGIVTADPLFESVNTSIGVQSAGRGTDDYRLATNSPCRETTDGASIVSRYWTTGPRPEGIDNPVPDRRACMGAYQQ